MLGLCLWLFGCEASPCLRAWPTAYIGCTSALACVIPAPLKSRYVTWGTIQVLYAFAFCLFSHVCLTQLGLLLHSELRGAAILASRAWLWFWTQFERKMWHKKWSLLARTVSDKVSNCVLMRRISKLVTWCVRWMLRMCLRHQLSRTSRAYVMAFIKYNT